MSDYKMTKKQKAYLESLVCQRISRDEANKRVIDAFSQDDEYFGITGALKTGWNADKQDRMAYYIIKDPADDQPLLFFSLKCGEVHQRLDPSRLEKSLTQSYMLLKAAYSRCGHLWRPRSYHPSVQEEYIYRVQRFWREYANIEVEDWATDVIAKQLVDDDLPVHAWQKIWRRVFRNQNKLDDYNADRNRERNNIIRTKKTFPAVELVHFCAHAPAWEKWQTLNMGQSLGKTMFWYFIEPAIRQIRELVGCEYIYLFAADAERTGKLCKLYQKLGFDFRDDLYVTKPTYDFRCYFMCQEVRRLRTRKSEFLKNYNKPEEKAQEPSAV